MIGRLSARAASPGAIVRTIGGIALLALLFATASCVASGRGSTPPPGGSAATAAARTNPGPPAAAGPAEAGPEDGASEATSPQAAQPPQASGAAAPSDGGPVSGSPSADGDAPPAGDGRTGTAAPTGSAGFIAASPRTGEAEGTGTEVAGQMHIPPARPGSSGGGGSLRDPTEAAAARVPRVRMLPVAMEAGVGDRLSLAIEISDGRDVASVPFHVVFNPAVLRFEGGEEGTFLRSGGTQTTFFAAPTSGGDKVVVGLSMLGPDQGTSGDGLLCSLRFAVIGSGAAGLAFARAHVRDGRNRILAATFEAATITAR